MWKCILQHESTYVSFAINEKSFVANLMITNAQKFFGLETNCDFFAKKIHYPNSYRIRREK